MSRLVFVPFDREAHNVTRRLGACIRRRCMRTTVNNRDNDRGFSPRDVSVARAAILRISSRAQRATTCFGAHGRKEKDVSRTASEYMDQFASCDSVIAC